MFSPNGQALQDAYVLNVLKFKRNGYFLEIGSHDAIFMSNTYKLEKEFDWTGLMVDFEQHYEDSYKTHRPNSKYIISDAQNVDYKSLFETYNFPENMDYLQIDLEVHNKSTLNTLLHLDATLFDTYKFATVTFEHDIYRGDFFDTRAQSRAIFGKRGYVRVFSDVKGCENPFEDWYVHPDLVDMTYVNRIKREESMEVKDIVALF